MGNTLIRTGDKVLVISGEAANVVSQEDDKEVQRQATVIAIDRLNGAVKLQFEGLSRNRDAQGRDMPIRGLEVLKNHRFNPQADDPGGQRVQARWIDISNVALIDPSTGKTGKIVRKKSGKGMVRVAVESGHEF